MRAAGDAVVTIPVLQFRCASYLSAADVDTPAGFAAWLERLAREPGRCAHRWIVEGDQVLGGIALRHEGNDFVSWAGHIGYGIGRPRAGVDWQS